MKASTKFNGWTTPEAREGKPVLPAAQELGFCEWLMRVEENLGYLIHSASAARMYNAGVAVMDAVVQLKDK